MVFAAIVIVAGGSCHGPLPGDPSHALPGRIQLTGSQQAAVVATAVTTPPSVQVWSRGGEPMPNLRMVFAVTGGGGAVTAATVSTDLDGVAAVGSWTLGTRAGVNKLTATVDQVDTGLVFTANGTPGPPTAITKVTGDSQTATVGTLVSVGPTVLVADRYGNAVPRVGVTFAVASGGGTATGTSVATDTVGRAAVGSWRLGAQGGAQTLSASVDSAAGVSAMFTATGLPPVKLGFVVQPSGVVAGAAISPAVQVAVQDARGNTVSIATDSVSLTITTGTGTSGATLGGTLTRAVVNGVATFAGLTLDKAGTGYTFTASATGLAAATSSAFAVTPGTANRLMFTMQPSSVAAGAAIAPAVQVAIQDTFGNTVTGSTANVTLAITSGTGVAGATLGGTRTRAAVSGVATFADLTLDKTGTGYTLTATATGLTSATSGAFAVIPGTVIGSQLETRLSAAHSHTCGLTTDGAAYCWGTNDKGQLGDGTTTWRTSPVAVSGGHIFQTISAGSSYTCGLTTDGVAYCWGWNAYGQLGDGTTSDRTSPVPVSGGLVFQAISGRYTHTCALTTGGAAYCWGYNSNGQLGDGTTGNRTSPVAVSGGLVFQTISAGSSHTCGLTAGGAPYCWGWNSYGQLGDGTTSDRTSPVAVSGGLVFQAISAGYQYTCGLTTGGAAYCWGFNYIGSPVAVSGGLVFQAISARGGHTCGLTTGGAAHCWGSNTYGQLGDGTMSDRLIPVAVSGGLVFQAISGGDYHTCGLTTGGAAYCWGRNDQGQLGDGTGVDRWSPVAVSGGMGQFALEFTQSYVSVADNDALDLSTSWTLEAWVYPTQASTGTFQDVMSKWGGGGNSSYQLAIGATGRLRVVTHDGTTNFISGGKTPLVNGVWQHIAATFDQGTVRMYVNGVLDTTATGVAAPMNSTLELAFGREGAYAGYTFGGVMDEVRIWNVARSAADIAAFRSSRLVGNETGLAGYWRFDDGTGDVASDATGRGNHGRLGTAVGADTWDPRWTTNGAPIR